MTASTTVVRAPSPFGVRFVVPLALGASLNPINSTMIATALVPIAVTFHASATQVGWLIAALYLASAIAQPTMGRLADVFGARRVFLVALLLVGLAGVLGPYAPSLGALVFVRILLGIGTSGAYPAAMRIFRVQADRVGSEPPRQAMSFLSMAALTTGAIGPLLGGVLTAAYGWHAIFTVNAPLALVTAALVLAWTPKDVPADRPAGGIFAEIDFTGMALFAATSICLMSFLMNLRHPLWLAPAGGIAFAAGLVAWSLRRPQPFIDVRMLVRNMPLTITYTRTAIVLLIVYAIIYGFAQWLESAAGFSSSAAGLVLLPLFVVGALSSIAGGRTKGIRGSFVIGIAAACVGCLALLFVHTGSPAWAISAAGALFGVPMGMLSTATQAAIYVQAEPKDIGIAAGLQRTAGYVGAISATSVLGLIYGQRATDAGFHTVAIVMGVLGAALLVATIVDRTIPKGRV